MTIPHEISLAAFIAEARRRAPRGATAALSESELKEPLGALLERYESAPDTLEHRVLARLLHAMAEERDQSAFPSTDVAALGPHVLALLAAFVDELVSGWYRRAVVRSLLLEHKISIETGTNGASG